MRYACTCGLNDPYPLWCLKMAASNPTCEAPDVVMEGYPVMPPSPRLSRRTQEEVVAENDTSSGEDPDNYPLHSPWSFWFDK